MKKVLLLPLLLFFFSQFNAQVTFQKTFAAAFSQNCYAITCTEDGGYALGASSNDFGVGDSDVWLIKLNALGDTLWTRTYGEAGKSKTVFSIYQSNDKGYIMTGMTSSSGPTDVYLIKADSLGNYQWSKKFGNGYGCIGYYVQQSTDGGYLVGGYMPSSATFGGIYFIKTNAVGDSLWTRTCNQGSSGITAGFSALQTPDGGYIGAGRTHIPSAGLMQQIFIAKTDAAGVVSWAGTYGETGVDEFATSISATADGGYIVSGIKGASTSAEMLLMKINSTGTLQWVKQYGGTNMDQGTRARQTADGGFIVYGITNSFGGTSINAYLVKTDSLGNVLWSKKYGGSSSYSGEGFDIAPDGGYVISGTLNGHVYIIKTDADGNTSCNMTNVTTIVSTPVYVSGFPATVDKRGTVMSAPPSVTSFSSPVVNTICLTTDNKFEAAENDFFDVFPNPVTEETMLNIRFPLKEGNLIIYDILGKAVRSIKCSGDEIKLGINDLQAGIYLVSIIEEGYNIGSKKVIVP